MPYVAAMGTKEGGIRTRVRAAAGAVAAEAAAPEAEAAEAEAQVVRMASAAPLAL